MKYYDLKKEIEKLQGIAENNNSLLKTNEEEKSKVAAIVNQNISNAKKILLQKKEVEEKIKELDAKLDELMNSTLDVYNQTSMSSDNHIRMFANSVAKLNDVAAELDMLINVKKPEIQNLIFEEEIEKKEKLIPIWNSIRDSFELDLNISLMNEKTCESETDDSEKKSEDSITQVEEDAELDELKKMIAASFEAPNDVFEDAIEDTCQHKKKKKSSLFSITKKRA